MTFMSGRQITVSTSTCRSADGHKELCILHKWNWRIVGPEWCSSTSRLSDDSGPASLLHLSPVELLLLGGERSLLLCRSKSRTCIVLFDRGLDLGAKTE